MAIRKKSFAGTLQLTQDANPEAARRGSPLEKDSRALSAKPVARSESIALSKRTVSRILLAKSLLGR